MAGTELRKLRLLAGQTQLDLEKESGIDRTRISLAETEQIKLTTEEAKRLARAVLNTMKRKMAEVETIAMMYEVA